MNLIELKCGVLNVCGLKRRLEYAEFLEEISQFDVLETNLHCFDRIEIPDCTFNCKHRENNSTRKSGGIGIFVRKTIAKHVRNIKSDAEYVQWVVLSKSMLSIEEDVVLGIVYIPPDRSKFYDESRLRTLENEIANSCLNYENVFLAGDCNARIVALTILCFQNNICLIVKLQLMKNLRL